jgi:Fe-Mn family superoxide dismutase
MNMSRPYRAKKFNLNELNGISDQTLEMHFKLYEGYVKETNTLQEKVSAILQGRQSRPGGDAGLFRIKTSPRL